MAVTDPIADMLTRIRNAQMALHKQVAVPASKAKRAIATILQNEGYIEGFSEENGVITIDLKVVGGRSVIAGLKRISSPGRRVYVGADDIPPVQGGLGISILSTSKGILDGGKAKESRVGGELLCEIW